jgi:nucleoside-diphosphate-sugar epimerase
METKRVFVTGATGAIGRPAVEALAEHGHEVSALARSADKAAWLRSRRATPVAVSLFDRDGLAGAFASHDAVVNLATALPRTHRFISMRAWEENNRIRTEGSRTVVDAALAAGVSVLVQESVSMLYPDRGDRWITEDTPPDRFPMSEANFAAEANAQRFSDEGGIGVVLRLGWFYGPGARHAEELFVLAKRHVCVQIGAANTYVSSIHVADGGRAVVAALGVPAGTYNVVDDEPLTKREYADALAAAARTTCWLRAPGRAAQLLGHRTTSLSRSLRVSNTKFRTASQWIPRFPSAREGWRATAEELESRVR